MKILNVVGTKSAIDWEFHSSHFVLVGFLCKWREIIQLVKCFGDHALLHRLIHHAFLHACRWPIDSCNIIMVSFLLLNFLCDVCLKSYVESNLMNAESHVLNRMSLILVVTQFFTHFFQFMVWIFAISIYYNGCGSIIQWTEFYS